MLFFIVLAVSLVAAVVGAITAPKMGRSPIEAFFLGFFLWPVALVMTIIAYIKR